MPEAAITLEQLARLVRDMRDKQRSYFRSQVGLAQCKRAEKVVDEAVAAVLNPPAPGLFNGDKP